MHRAAPDGRFSTLFPWKRLLRPYTPAQVSHVSACITMEIAFKSKQCSMFTQQGCSGPVLRRHVALAQIPTRSCLDKQEILSLRDGGSYYSEPRRKMEQRRHAVHFVPAYLLLCVSV